MSVEEEWGKSAGMIADNAWDFWTKNRFDTPDEFDRALAAFETSFGDHLIEAHKLENGCLWLFKDGSCLTLSVTEEALWIEAGTWHRAQQAPGSDAIH